MPIRIFNRIVAGFILFFFASPAFADGNSAQIVSVRASSSIISSARTEPAAVSREVLSGDELKTDDFGRLSVLLPNQLLLKVAEQTQFIYEGPGANGVSGKILAGKVWLRGQKQPVPFELNTPTATAAIRGTEWYVEVAKDGATKVGVIDGLVQVSNSLGSVELGARDLALVEPGKAPVKLAYVTPANAVNWTLNYFGLWEKSDLAHDGSSASPVLRSMIDAYYRNDLAEAYRLLNSMSGSQNSASYQAARGFLLLVSGNDKEARKWFERAHTTAPQWALPTAHLSLISLVQDDLSHAASYAEEAVSVQPGSAVAHLAKAYALKGQLKLDDAYAEAKRAVEIAPDFQEALLVAAEIALEMERLSEAKDFLARASDSAPPQGRKATLEGYLALRADRESARQCFERALAAEPDSPDALIGLGLALFHENEPDKAIDAILRATLLAPQVSDYQSYLAKAYTELGRDGDAEQVLGRAKRLDPKDPTPYLYEALIEQARFRPGQAFLQLLEARKRNDNRAVLRSKYLLDQDRSVLTSNLSQVYHEIGFDHSATQEAARANEIDPTNSEAHRRQFFALQFDPRNYAQAASSERLLNNMFMLPTRTAVVVSEEFLSPYQNVFDRPGVDPVLRGRGSYDHTDTEIDRTADGSGILAAEFSKPLAVALELGGTHNTFDSSGISKLDNPRLNSEDRSEDDLSARAFAKWQMTTATEVFGEFRLAGVDRSREGEEVPMNTMSQRRALARAREKTTDIMMPPPPAMSGAPGNMTGQGSMTPGMSPPDMMTAPTTPPTTQMRQMPSMALGDINSDVNSDLYDFDTGLHSKLTPTTDGLLHVSYHRSDDTIDDTKTTDAEVLNNSKDSSFDFWIAQTALWQRFGENHFAQLGFRHYDQNVTDDTSEEEQPGMPMKTSNGDDARLESAFLVDQYTGIPNVTATFGLNVDALDFKLQDGRGDNHTEVGPSFGVAWEFLPATFLRAAVIHNAAGDRNERLQQTLIAGFPWQRLTLIDPYSDEQLFHLTYETYVAALDTYFEDPVVFIGLVSEQDQHRPEEFAENGDDTQDLTVNVSKRFRFYAESLLTPEWSATFTYRFDTFQFPDDTDRHGVSASLAYFTNSKIAFRFGAQYLNLENAGLNTFDGEGDDKGTTFVPAIDGYPFGNRMRMTLQAPFNSGGDYSVRLNFFWYINS